MRCGIAKISSCVLGTTMQCERAAGRLGKAFSVRSLAFYQIPTMLHWTSSASIFCRSWTPSRGSHLRSVSLLPRRSAESFLTDHTYRLHRLNTGTKTRISFFSRIILNPKALDRTSTEIEVQKMPMLEAIRRSILSRDTEPWHPDQIPSP